MDNHEAREDSTARSCLGRDGPSVVQRGRRRAETLGAVGSVPLVVAMATHQAVRRQLVGTYIPFIGCAVCWSGTFDKFKGLAFLK